MAVDLIELTNTDRRFYPLLGPFLASRAVVKAVGGPIWDDDTKTWLVLRRDKQILGFVAVAARAGRTVVESLYAPGVDRVASELIGAAVDRYGSQDLHTVVQRDHAAGYLAAGFKVTSATRQFVRLHRKASP
jgi:hypothetical protein